MPGLKELSDRTAGRARQSRAIAFYTSAFGLGSSLSLWMAGALQSPRLARGLPRRGRRPLAAAALVLLGLPRARSSRRGDTARPFRRRVA
jgi:hypothetical protein